jgi:drug/metabolite transporter (DMT)-like permease
VHGCRRRLGEPLSALESFHPRPAVAYTLLIIGTVVWGSGTVLGRGVRDIVPPVGLGFWRLSVVVIALLPLVWSELIRLQPVIRKHWRLFVLLAVLQMWPQVITLVAVNFTTAINATLINAAQPALTAIITALVFRGQVSLGAALGVTLALIGVGVMVAHGSLGELMAMEFNIGDLLAFGAVLLWSCYALCLPRVPREIGIATTLFLMAFAGAATMLPFYLIETIWVRPVHFNGATVATVLWMGLIISTASIFVWNVSLRVLGPQRATIFLNLNPVWAALFAVVFLGEALYPYHFAGAAFVCAGIILVVRT